MTSEYVLDEAGMRAAAIAKAWQETANCKTLDAHLHHMSVTPDRILSSRELEPIIRAYLDALSNPPKVGSGELDAAEPVAWRWKNAIAGGWEAWSWLKVEPTWLAGDGFLVQPLYLHPAAPVDHPEVVGVAMDVEGALMAIGEELGLTSVTAYNCIDEIRRLRELAALQPSDSPALEAGVAERARGKFDLWFFRDMSDDQRLALFSIFEMPVDEIGKVHGHQRHALKRILRALSIPAKEDGK